nr:MAG TPA: hypothetical protein [Crassvirales sp.]
MIREKEAKRELILTITSFSFFIYFFLFSFFMLLSFSCLSLLQFYVYFICCFNLITSLAYI